MTFNPSEYKDVEKKVKILKADSQERLIRELEEFEKTHIVIDIKQYTADRMFVFYTE